MANCLVLIDIQYGFLNNKTQHIPYRLQQLVKTHDFDHVVATEFRNTQDSPYVEFLGWNGLMDEEEQQLADEIADLAEQIFVKNGYSCCTNDFVEYLYLNKIDRIYLAGVDTEACVLKSAMDAFEQVYLVQ